MNSSQIREHLPTGVPTETDPPPVLRTRPNMKSIVNHSSALLLIPALTFWCTSPALAATSTIVLESNQSPLDGSMRDGGSGIGGGEIKVLPFTSGTSWLELTSMELGLVRLNSANSPVPDGNYQINFNLYSASNTGEPQTLLYSTSFTPYITAVSTWFTLPISYTLSPSTSYAFGLTAPTVGTANWVKWSNTSNSLWPPIGSQGYAGIGVTNAGFTFWYDTTNSSWSWISSASDNAFRLNAVPETSAGILPGLGLGLAAVGILRLRRRWNH